jgi:AAA+ ATPase superfamily predicted ATPase
MKFINRQKELEFLEKAHASKGFQFVPIYGRRRIGKTELVKQFSKDKKAFYYLADTLDEKTQLKILGNNVGDLFDDFLVREQGFRDWYSFFKFLKVKSDESDDKLVVIIDEFPYLVKANPAISSIFQKGIDEYLKYTNIFLILMGSLIGMMEKEVLNYKAPLYGRRTGSLKLEEMSFFEVKDFFPGESIRELVNIYTVCGVVPGYLEKYTGSESFDDFLLKNVFNKGGFFYEEAEMVLRQDFYEPGTYYSILRAVALGNRKLGEIMSETGLEKSKISKYLKVLKDAMIIKRDVPVTEKNPEKSKRGLFSIKDKYLNFWFRFVLGNKNYIEIGRFDYIFSKVKQQITDYQGVVFEDICRQYLLRNIGKYEFHRLERWWEKEEEIDLVAIDQEKNRFIFVECKYRNKQVDVGVYENLKRKIGLVKWHKDFEVGKIVIFSASGFKKDLLDLAEKEEKLELISLEEML